MTAAWFGEEMRHGVPVCLQYAWKLLHPTDKYSNRECPDDAEEYERVRLVGFSVIQELLLRPTSACCL